MLQIRDCTCAVLFLCYLSTTVAHLLLDDIEHAILFCSHLSVFKMLKFVHFFPYKKSVEKYEKKQKTLLEIFACAGVPIIHSIGFFLGKIQVSLTIKKPGMYAFLWSS